MSNFYRIETYSAKTVKLEIHDKEETELHFLTHEGQRVSVILPQSQLRSLRQQIDAQLPAE